MHHNSCARQIARIIVPASSSQLQARERASEGASAIGVFQGMGLHRPAIAKKNAELV
jgi:hypothetical protein